MLHGNHTNDRIAPVLSRLHREMGEMEERVDELVEAAMGRLGSGEERFRHPIIAGCAIRLDKEGRHRFVPFGNVRHGLSGLQDGWREPQLVWQVDEAEDAFVLEAELPGVKKDEIHVEVEPDLVRIQASGKERRYEAEVNPGVVLGKRSRAEYNDGVLRLTVRLAKRTKGKTKEVKVKG